MDVVLMVQRTSRYKRDMLTVMKQSLLYFDLLDPAITTHPRRSV